MASLVVLLIILGCAAYQYQKGTLVKSFATVIVTICASAVAFGYFEVLANVFISHGGSSRYPSIVPWAQPLSFILLFVLAFAILKTISGRLTRHPVDLGLVPERVGRVVCGILLGLILSGLLSTALATAPLPNKYPYQRFNQTRPDPEKPKKVLLNVDGFATGLFGIISSGSFSGERSFAALHPVFLDQVFLNRHSFADGIPIVTSSQAIEVPRKKAAWYAPESLKFPNGKPVPSKRGHDLTIVRVGLKKSTIREAGKFTLSQLRLVCKQKRYAENPLAGKSKNIYPIGYLKMANQLQTKKLNEKIEIKGTDFDTLVKPIDFAFYVPKDFQPVLLEFKQNSIARVPPLVPAEQVPPAVSFIQMSKCALNAADVNPITSAKVYGAQLAASTKFLTGLKLEIQDQAHWQSSQTARSIKMALFEDGKISYVKAELKIVEPTEDNSKSKGKGVPRMLRPLDGYKLLSLKCNNPSTGVAIKAEQLPVLVELSGSIHHPVGIITSGKVGDQTIYEVDYCSLTTEYVPDGLVIAEDGSIARPFPDTIWLTEQARSIGEFFTLYLVKSGKKTIITGVRPGDSQTSAAFKKYEGFLIR